MKKSLFYLALIAFLSISLVSCSEDDDDNNGVNPTPTNSFEFVSKDETISSLASVVEELSYATIKNISNEEKKVNVKLVVKTLAPGHTVAFCTHLCFMAQTSDWEAPSSQFFTIPAGGDSGFLNGGQGFSAHFYPNGNSGTSEVEFIFFNVDNPDDNVSYTVTYTAM